jgi:RecJ-like exonuclease
MAEENDDIQWLKNFDAGIKRLRDISNFIERQEFYMRESGNTIMADRLMYALGTIDEAVEEINNAISESVNEQLKAASKADKALLDGILHGLFHPECTDTKPKT